jgi:hypothetical protein
VTAAKTETKTMARKWTKFADWLRGRQTVDPKQLEEERLREEIDTARKAWAIALKHMDYVSDHDLIDHAIYSLEAAERKYGYLLREAKKREKLKRLAQEEKSRPAVETVS